jgi:acyl phosphate:glycerol-3-phosphate acyltransferase
MQSPAAQYAIALVAGYFLGALAPALWIPKWFYGVDITKVGSGNPGMTNVLRTLGWKPALPVTLLDAGKGFAAAWVGHLLTGTVAGALAGGVAAVLGHSFTCFARFKGGKGVLTGFGVFLFLTPLSALAGLAAWTLVVGMTRYVSLGSMVASVVLPVGVFLEARLRGGADLMPVLWAAVLVSSFVLYRHRSNLGRLLNGTENKIGRKSA